MKLEGEAALEQITEASGLAPVIAKGVIARCCTKPGIDIEHLELRDVGRLLPQMEPLLRLYLKPDEATTSIERLRSLAAGR